MVIYIKDNDWTSRPTRSVVIFKRSEDWEGITSDLMRLSIVLDPSIISIKEEKQIIILNYDLPFHFSELLFIEN